MPGHKGKRLLGFEEYDITEVQGADSLYEAKGIIKESEENAGRLFGCETFYSTEGSSQCIRAMLYLVMLYAGERGAAPVIAAGRNAHKVFLTAAALLNFEINWFYGKESYLNVEVTPKALEVFFEKEEQKPVAFYLTSPDYLGNIPDIKGIAEVCHKNGVLLVVDNAHGAYLKFLNPSAHPIDLFADLCCDSAHKTLPALTGGAYLHIGKNAPKLFSCCAREALELFGSTSPSYLILQSLDRVNKYLSDGYCEKLSEVAEKIKSLKERLKEKGFQLEGSEPLKITLATKSAGYKGCELAKLLYEENNIVCEFADPDFIVFMLTPENGEDIPLLERALLNLPFKEQTKEKPPLLLPCERVMSPRKALLSEKEELKVEKCEGRVLAGFSVSCPPAVPIVVCGEKINKNAIENFKYYGIKKCKVVKETEELK